MPGRKEARPVGTWGAACQTFDVATAKVVSMPMMTIAFRRAGLRHAGAQRFGRNRGEAERRPDEFRDESGALSTRVGLRPGSVVDRTGMAVANNDAGNRRRSAF